ncbi:hypothetical protein M2104_004546 [Paenibacillus sp. PastH-2]|nr:hypothetical protein [Paenibacillus sp. PastH-2]
MKSAVNFVLENDSAFIGYLRRLFPIGHAH